MPLPFEEWWRGIKCKPLSVRPCVRVSVVSVCCMLCPSTNMCLEGMAQYMYLHVHIYVLSILVILELEGHPFTLLVL